VTNRRVSGRLLLASLGNQRGWLLYLSPSFKFTSTTHLNLPSLFTIYLNCFQLSESSFSSKAAKFLSTRLGISLLILATSALLMFTFTNSLFSVYKQNVFFLHSSGVASHMVEKILLDVQGLRSAHVTNNTSMQVLSPVSPLSSGRINSLYRQGTL
jgi:hypothetical protein